MYKNKEYVDVIVNKLEKEDFNAYYYKNYKKICLNREEKERLKEYFLFQVSTPEVIYLDISKWEVNEFLIKCSLKKVEGGNTQIFVMEFTGEPIKIDYEKEKAKQLSGQRWLDNQRAKQELIDEYKTAKRKGYI
jgi:hypothetical protein